MYETSRFIKRIQQNIPPFLENFDKNKTEEKLAMLINPKKAGWFSEVIAFRKANLEELLIENKKALSSLLTIYQAIQPVGLINGQLFGNISYPNSEVWTPLEKTQILFADCVISSSLLNHDNLKIKDDAIADEVIAKTVTNIGYFYQALYPQMGISYNNLFGKRKNANELAEAIFEKRVRSVIDNNHKLVEQFFHNGLLFLDIYIFSRWVNTQRDEVASILFKSLLEDYRFSVLKVIAAAAHSNKSIATAEKDFMESFIKSSYLPTSKIAEAREIFAKGIEIRELEVHPDNTWVVKKYFLEMAIVTIWSDKIIDDDEMLFLEKFTHYLDLSTRDLERSLFSVKEMVPEKNLEWK
jgi:hypothetical protein